MEQVCNRKILLAKRPHGRVSANDFKFDERVLPETGQGEVLVKNEYLSIDPTHRIWMSQVKQYMEPIKIGEVIRSFGLGSVLESHNPRFKKGQLVSGLLGWQSHCLSDGSGLQVVDQVVEPVSSLLSIYGVTGVTAYFGLLDIAEPQKGETVLVSAAAGAVGSVVGQIAKIMGCRVVGICGSDRKCDWLVNVLGFDAAIQYKKENLSERLKKTCPDGIDIYFENVGGKILDAVLMHLNRHARVPLCGLISDYNKDEAPEGPSNFSQILMQRVKLEGFIITDYAHRWGEAVSQLAQWVASGQISYQEDIVEGLESIPSALNKLFDGSNSGKLMVKLND